MGTARQPTRYRSNRTAETETEEDEGEINEMQDYIVIAEGLRMTPFQVSPPCAHMTSPTATQPASDVGQLVAPAFVLKR